MSAHLALPKARLVLRGVRCTHYVTTVDPFLCPRLEAACHRPLVKGTHSCPCLSASRPRQGCSKGINPWWYEENGMVVQRPSGGRANGIFEHREGRLCLVSCDLDPALQLIKTGRRTSSCHPSNLHNSKYSTRPVAWVDSGIWPRIPFVSYWQKQPALLVALFMLLWYIRASNKVCSILDGGIFRSVAFDDAQCHCRAELAAQICSCLHIDTEGHL